MSLRKIVGAAAMTTALAACGEPKEPYLSYDSVSGRSIPTHTLKEIQAERDGKAMVMGRRNCPKVGELATTPAGQISITIDGSGGTTNDLTDREGGQRVLFVSSKREKRVAGSWVGMNAFGATRRAETHVSVHTGIGFLAGEAGSNIERHWYKTALRHGATKLWASGTATGHTFTHQDTAAATFSDPVELRLTMSGPLANLNCAAVVDDGGIILERLY
jgi:hypothetical protein